MANVFTIIIQIFLIYLNKNDAIFDGKMSPLGIWLRSPEGTAPPKKIDNIFINNPPLILVWKYGPTIERRHIQQFYKNHQSSPWDGCSVDKCQLSYNITDMERADAVVFHVQRMQYNDVKEMALWSREKRRRNQIWIFLTDESPMNTRIYSEYNGLFNWTMNYRIDSDIPVAYGRTILRQHNNSYKTDFNSIIKKKTKFIAIMGSNCQMSSASSRWKYVQELLNYLPNQLDIYGHCLNGNKTACPGHFFTDCHLLNEYKFYLAFENSNCQQYLTEKVFWNAYSKFSVPIIMGSPQDDCKKLLPPHSYIHVGDFSSPFHLAEYLSMLDLSDDAYLEYHKWRNNYIVLNEHGYFGAVSRHYCRICESLHYNPTVPSKTYWDLEKYWNKYDQCTIDPINNL